MNSLSIQVRRAAFWMWAFGAAAALAQNPPLSVEISAEHPLCLFAFPVAAGAQSAAPQALLDAWKALPDTLKPFSAMSLAAPQEDPEALRAAYEAVLNASHPAGIPVVLALPGTLDRQRIAAESLEAMLNAYTSIKGVRLDGLRFDRYAPPGGEAPEVDMQAAWAAEVVALAARYGRFTMLPLEGMHALRCMANATSAPLREAMRAAAGYVIPASVQRGPHVQIANAALLGWWLEGACGQWGVAADARWHGDAAFVSPGVFGYSAQAAAPPASLYRAMAMLGAMCGARVYTFDNPADLWFGVNNAAWDAAIAPILRQLIDQGLIARPDFLQKLTPVAYELAPIEKPDDFAPALQDFDGVYNRGTLAQAVYGFERPGQTPELIPNRSERFWIPILSPEAPPDVRAAFASLVHPMQAGNAANWDATIAPRYTMLKPNTPYTVRVGRGLFVMNTRENVEEPQDFAVDAPAPVRGLTATRSDGKTTLTWPFREGDVSYGVWRRVDPDKTPVQLARGLTERKFEDLSPPADKTVAYAVTALTSETELYKGVVHCGDYLALSAVESRIAEEVVLTPVLATAQSAPIAAPPEPPAPAPWWPGYDGLNAEQQVAAAEIVARIDAWDAAIAAGDLNAASDLYAKDYADAQGWGHQYVRRAYQWLFERYRGRRLHRQIRTWDFSAAPDKVSVKLYARITAAATTDVSGRIASQPISFPPPPAETTMTWVKSDGAWRAVKTEPPMPNFRDLLQYAAGPLDGLGAGSDVYSPKP